MYYKWIQNPIYSNRKHDYNLWSYYSIWQRISDKQTTLYGWVFKALYITKNRSSVVKLTKDKNVIIDKKKYEELLMTNYLLWLYQITDY